MRTARIDLLGWTFFGPLALWGVVAAPAVMAAGVLSVHPASVQLDSARDAQRVVLVWTREDGVTQDVTGQATRAFQPEGIAHWGEDGLLHPNADGDASLVLTYGEQSVTVPIHVANSGVTPPINFRNDVEPVLMRAGCNAGSCHGSAQGKNGFRLSLFGFDPSLDYVNLTRQVRGRRMNAANPEESLMLLKPTGDVDHEGGTRFAHDSPLYRTVEDWITEGAQDHPEQSPALNSVEILPKEVVLEGEGATQQFVVRAFYSDGTDRDVTGLALLSTSDDSTLKLDDNGLATGGARGEVYVLARYGSFAVVSQAIVLARDQALAWPEVPEGNYIDRHVFTKLRKLRIPPAEPCSDETFVRRAHLDVLGVLPTVEETRSFLSDTAPDKRAQLINRLLERPEFPELWAMKWADLLRVRATTALAPKAMHRYNDWLRGSIASGKPLDVMVTELLTAQGGTFANPAANFYVVETEPIVIAENVAQVFFGIQIKCAQCHNHPFERWTMDDYYSFAAFFAQVGRKGSSDPRESVIFDRRSGEVTNIKDGRQMPPKFLGGAIPDVSSRDRRAVLAEWLVSPDNPWFAKNIANRVWAHFLGKGIVDPPDDARVTNPPTHPGLLDELGSRLVANRYDLRALVRDICTSYTYQMTTRPREPSIVDDRNFSHAMARRIPAEQLLDAISSVAMTKFKFPNLPLGARAVQVADGNSGNYFLSLFGRPMRDTVCVCERRGEPTLAQTLHLINGDTVQAALAATGGRVEALAQPEIPPASACEDLYLAAFSRPPTAEERRQLSDYVAGSTDRRAALEDMMWSVFNSKEFVFNH
ncbi:MAG: DUF1549 domain-containing protein [Candidatus Omnitrophica bacterium]|nr:hypothetical protein [bacterium]NUN97712.1 DUF1549 domain-containing protein [Candidatus Omnitrophota bacterium]